MNLLPKRSLLAVAAVVDIALHARAAPVSARALSERHGLMPRHFESLLQELVRANILKGFRGPRGGYELARERRRITVSEILRAADKVGDADAKPRASPSHVETTIVKALQAAADAFLAELEAITIDDLCLRAETLGTHLSGDLDFTI